MRDSANSELKIGTLSKKRLNVQVIIPTLNEETTIREVIHDFRLTTFPIDISIVVIDGGSSDKTVLICKDENVPVISQKRKGKGSAIREAVEESQADIIVFVDGDGTYSADNLDKILDPLLADSSDIVIGSRFLGSRESGSISTLNTFGNKIFNRAINFALGTSVTDSLSGYRALFRSVFNDLILLSDAFEIEVEMTVEGLTKGYRIFEVPISYKLRHTRSATKLSPMGDGVKIAKTLLSVLINVNPLKFFGLFSLVFFVIALWPTSQVLYEKISTGYIVSIPATVLSALLLVTSGLSLIMGMLAELTVRSRRRLEFLVKKQFEARKNSLFKQD